MTKPTKIVKRLYTKEDLEVALTKIKEGMAIKRASKTFNIPRGTLQNRIHNRTKKSANFSGPPSVLSKKEEQDIVNWIGENARKGFPRRESDLFFVVKEFLDNNPRENPFTENMPGKTWYRNFRRRHPRIALRTPEAVTSASSKVSESDIRGWFQQIEDYCEEHGMLSVLQDSTRLFNADETSFLMCPKTGRVLAPKGMKNVYEIEQGKSKEAITTLFTFSAAGDTLTPLIVYPYVRIPNDIRESLPDDFAVDKSKSGWMNQDIFYDFIKNTFYPDLVKRNVIFPVILFVDGHQSHLSLKLSDLCTELNIVLVCLPPNATRIIQPADVSCFKPVKTGWSNAVTIWRRDNVDKMLTKVRFPKILKIVIDNYINPTIIKNGFRLCGLYPFDQNAIDYTKCLGKNRTVNSEENDMENEEIKTNDLITNTQPLTLAIDLQRFKEIVGHNNMIKLSQFDYEKPCSSDFKLLHTIFTELSSGSFVEQLVEPITPTDIMEVGKCQDLDIAINETLIDEEFGNSNGFEIINVADPIVVEQKEASLENYLTVPPTPSRKGKKKNQKNSQEKTRQRQFVITSELNKMELKIKLDEKVAKEEAAKERKRKVEERKKVLEEKNQKREEREKVLEEKMRKQEERKEELAEAKARKLELYEIKKLEKLKKASEKEEINRKRAAQREEKASKKIKLQAKTKSGTKKIEVYRLAQQIST